MHYNFCRIHQTLRVTPAMEAGLTDHVWEIEDLVDLLGWPGATAVTPWEPLARFGGRNLRIRSHCHDLIPTNLPIDSGESAGADDLHWNNPPGVH
jgi:hypothetical protein